MANTVTMKMSPIRGSMARHWQTRLVLPLSLTLAGGLAPAHGQSPEVTPPVILTQAVGVSFQKNVGAFTGGTLSLGTSAGSAAAVTSGLILNSGAALIKSGGALNLDYPTGSGAVTVTISGGTLQFGNSQRISGSASVVNFTGGTTINSAVTMQSIVHVNEVTLSGVRIDTGIDRFISDSTSLVPYPYGTTSGATTIRRTISPTSLIQPSGSALDLANYYNLQPTETTGGLVKTGAGTLQLSPSFGMVTAFERPAIYPLDPSVAPTGLLTGGTLRLFQPTGSLVNAGTLTLTGNSTGSLLTVGGVNPGTSIYAGAPLSLATGSTIVPTSGAILTVNGSGNQIITGSNALTLNTNGFTGSTLSITGGTLSPGTLLLRANSDSALTLNGQTVLSGANILSGGQTLSLAAPVPEPGSVALLLCGALGLAVRRRRRSQSERA
jgi:hypothetical protein